MPDQELIAAIEQGDLIVQVDATRSLYDPHALGGAFLQLVNARLALAREKNIGTLFGAADRAGAAARVAESRRKLLEFVRNYFNFLQAVPAEDVALGEREETYERFLFPGGKLGELAKEQERVEQIAKLAVDPAALAQTVPALQPTVSLRNRIANWLGILLANEQLAAGGSLQTLFEEKDAAREALIAANGRVRHHYCAASDARERNPELARIGFQVRRDAGEAQPQPLPGALGTVSVDEAARELVAPALPPNTSFLRAYRQVPGGEPERAGVSETLRVPLTQFAPAAPGVIYTAWLVGVSSRGEGPESNRVTFVG